MTGELGGGDSFPVRVPLVPPLLLHSSFYRTLTNVFGSVIHSNSLCTRFRLENLGLGNLVAKLLRSLGRLHGARVHATPGLELLQHHLHKALALDALGLRDGTEGGWSRATFKGHPMSSKVIRRPCHSTYLGQLPELIRRQQLALVVVQQTGDDCLGTHSCLGLFNLRFVACCTKREFDVTGRAR